MSLTLADILMSHRTGTPVVMGILNVTPDSFSDGGQFLDPAAALTGARRMIEEGADVLDLGAESTRPGSQRVEAAEQIRRLEPILPAVCRLGAVVSVDTTRSAVAEYALDAGAAIVNDISAGRDDPALLGLCGRRGAAVVLMHMRGEPATMQAAPVYTDVVGEVRAFLGERLAAAEAAGVPRQRCLIDPGIGFGKTLEHNLALLGGLGQLAALDRPVLVGPSRKGFLGALTGRDVAAERSAGTIGACVAAFDRGATVFRVHDVAAVREALAVARAVRDAAAGR